MTEAFELLMKSCAKFDLLFVNIQCATAYSLKKLEFKVQIAVSVEPFQLLQQNSRHILREHSHRKSESLAQIRATITELQHFLRDCCLLAHPVDSIKAIQLRSSSCR